MSECLYLSKGKIEIKCGGYWFSSAGGKGSFGYFPHLKDPEGYPLFPDTELLGDIKFFINYFLGLKGKDKALFKRYLLQDRKNLLQSRLLVTDLELTEESKKAWSRDRFQILPRIKIDPERRSVEKHMLAFFEASYLEGLTLTADIYLGYVAKRDELQALQELIQEALKRVGGIGAFRSRGFGRGEFKLSWNGIEQVRYEPQARSDKKSGNFKIVLKNLVNFRNKRILEGSYQNVTTYFGISSIQFKSWIVRIYRDLFGQWLDYELYSKIHVSDILPSKDGEISSPPPMTFIKEESEGEKDVRIVDAYGRRQEDEEESIYLKKPKQLGDNYFVLNNTVIEIESIRRFRNVFDADTFTTKKEEGAGGLFTQEFIKKGQDFSGSIYLEPGIDGEVTQRLLFILENVRPMIGFSIFETHLEPIEKISAAEEEADGWLLLRDIPYQSGILNYYKKRQGSPKNYVTLSTIHTYSTVLKRRRRPIIGIKQGSIIEEAGKDIRGSVIPYRKLKGEIEIKKDAKPSIKEEHVLKEKRGSLKQKDKVTKISSSQIGIIYRFKEQYLINPKACKKRLKEYLDKYNQWGHEIEGRLPKRVLEELFKVADQGKEGDFMSTIESYLDSYYHLLFCEKYAKRRGN